ncbi:MAG TPA: bifunctional YncE family protein/alkaline phosphatase family protein [Candidatus Elarobacter sp.]|nr:bifunctional YncE family protein/alkaline phosphatase family protein [Candidatus Elarobacter sp.]
MKRALGAKGVLAALAGVVALGAAAFAAVEVTTLPTQWKIRAADGPVATVGTLPTGIALSRDGSQLFELEAGYRKPALRVLDAATLHEIRSVPLSGAYGAPLRDANGDGVWVAVAGTFQEAIAHVDTASGSVDRTVSLPVPFYPAALARNPRGGEVAVAGDLANRIAIVGREQRVVRTIDAGHHPAALLYAPDGATLYAADRGSETVEAFAANGVRRARITVGLHPVALASDGKLLYAAVSDDDTVAVIDLATNRLVQRARIPFARRDAVGTSPNALTLDGDRLYVPCGAANAVAVFRTGPRGLTPLGAIPAGWYPTAVAVDRAHRVLYVANGKGESGHANPGYTGRGDTGYVAASLVGSIRRIAIPDDAALARGLADVRALAQHENVPASMVVRANGPIRHVIYVIKENRSYDQVLGDVAGADGDPSIVMYGEKVTPNQHALVKRFGVFDRFFEDSHVSADGHNWSTAAFANDYLEKMWPQNYANRRPFYDFEDGAEAAVPHAGYLWDDAAKHRVSLRNYGEFVTAGPSAPTPVSSMNRVLNENTDRNFATFDLNVEDVTRFAEWKREFDAYERSRTLPALEIVRFPRDHTSGTRAGQVTPSGMVADNDLAVGKLAEAVSHSPDWSSTAIFVVEDDAQNGPDHVDEQRSTFYLISPYAAGGVQHAAYTQASVLRTIEILLGLSPMSPYDAGAMPLTAAFTATPNLAPFDALPAQVDVKAKNATTAYRAADSARLDFAHADAADEATVNDILWHDAKGAAATPPPYGVFR